MNIMINTVVLCLDYAGASKSWSDSLALTNKVFTFMFAAEAAFKFIGLGPQRFIKASLGRNTENYLKHRISRF